MGTNGRHIDGWKKCGIDPNGNGSWELVLAIIKTVVDNYDRLTEKAADNGGRIIYYYKYFSEYGLEILVKIWESSDGTIQNLSDAWACNQ